MTIEKSLSSKEIILDELKTLKDEYLNKFCKILLDKCIYFERRDMNDPKHLNDLNKIRALPELIKLEARILETHKVLKQIKKN